MTGRPELCVVVSAYNRSNLLPALVDALKAQTVKSFEAILVDNGSTDDTEAVLRRCTADDRRFRVVRVEDNRGPGRARNEAWRLATAPVIAFTDDDCAPEPTWLERLASAAESAEVVQGCTLPAVHPPGSNPSWFDRSQRIVAWSGRYETCNLAIHRDTLEQLDGFDEQFHIAMGEDTDFGLRAVAAGARTAFAEGAIVVHHQWPGSFREFLRYRRRYAESVQLIRVNPAARSLLAGGYVLRGVHLLVWLLIPVALIGALVGWWWAPLVVVGAWIVRHAHRNRHRPFSAPRRLGYCALQFVGYAYETWCFAVASLRYRALVI